MRIKGLWLSVLFSVAGGHAHATPLDDANASMQQYCMAGVCLGMTLDQVASLPAAELTLDDKLEARPLCGTDFGNGVTGRLTVRDGSRFLVVFRQLPGPGRLTNRYRVSSLTLRMPAVGAQLDAFLAEMATRYEFESRGRHSWIKETPLFRVNVVASEARSADQVSPVAMYEDATGDLAAWLQARPECRKAGQRLAPKN